MIAKETISMHKDVAKKYEAGRIMYHVSISHECYGDVLKSSLCTSRTFFSYKRVCASSQKGIACDWIVLFASRRSKQTRNTFQRKKKMKMNDKHYHWRWKRIGYSSIYIPRRALTSSKRFWKLEYGFFDAFCGAMRSERENDGCRQCMFSKKITNNGNCFDTADMWSAVQTENVALGRTEKPYTTHRLISHCDSIVEWLFFTAISFRQHNLPKSRHLRLQPVYSIRDGPTTLCLPLPLQCTHRTERRRRRIDRSPKG